MQCVVLAGGLATRMRPATDEIPKWLLPVAGRPFAEWQLGWLAENGVGSVVACVGHLGSQIRDQIGSGASFGLTIEYSDDGDRLLGTGGALRWAAAQGLLDDRFLVLYGDSFLPIAVPPVWEAFASGDRPALMTVYRNEGRFDTSNVAFDDGAVVTYSKHPDAQDLARLDYIDYGLSAFERAVIEGLPAGEPSDLATLLESLAARRLVAGYEVGERFYEIGSPAGLRDLEQYLSEQGLPA